MLSRKYGTVDIKKKFKCQWKNVTTIILFSSLQEVEKILKSYKWNFSWDDNNNLRYWYIHSPVRPHPVTGGKMWFNQVTSYNASYFRDLPLYKNINMPDDHYPFHSYYGDGSIIQPSVLQHIRAAMWSCAMGFSWRTNDVVVIDNLQVLHGRMGWTGERTLSCDHAYWWVMKGFLNGRCKKHASTIRDINYSKYLLSINYYYSN